MEEEGFVDSSILWGPIPYVEEAIENIDEYDFDDLNGISKDGYSHCHGISDEVAEGGDNNETEMDDDDDCKIIEIIKSPSTTLNYTNNINTTTTTSTTSTLANGDPKEKIFIIYKMEKISNDSSSNSNIITNTTNNKNNNGNSKSKNQKRKQNLNERIINSDPDYIPPSSLSQPSPKLKKPSKKYIDFMKISTDEFKEPPPTETEEELVGECQSKNLLEQIPIDDKTADDQHQAHSRQEMRARLKEKLLKNLTKNSDVKLRCNKCFEMFYGPNSESDLKDHISQDHFETSVKQFDTFAETFKYKRIKLGYTQEAVGYALGKMYGKELSQVTISKFETLNLSINNMSKVKPILRKWLEDAEANDAANNTSTEVKSTSIRPDIVKKKRNKIGQHAHDTLEEAFLKHRSLVSRSEQVSSLADDLNMEEKAVRIWFNNRRQKERRLNNRDGKTTSRPRRRSPGPPRLKPMVPFPTTMAAKAPSTSTFSVPVTTSPAKLHARIKPSIIKSKINELAEIPNDNTEKASTSADQEKFENSTQSQPQQTQGRFEPDKNMDDGDHLNDLDQSIQPRPSKIAREEFDIKNPFQDQQQVELKLEMEADGDGPSKNANFQSKSTQVVKIEEFDEKNPFQVPVILDVLFDLFSFEEVKKFRLVSSEWNQVGFKLLNKIEQKTINFNMIEELKDDNKLGELIQLQRRHKEVFPYDHHQLFSNFSNFSFNIQLLRSPQIDQFFAHFSTKFVKFYGYPILKPTEDLQQSSEEEEDDEEDEEENVEEEEEEVDEVKEEGVDEVKEEEVDEESDHQLAQLLSKFLIKISPTVQEIKYNDLYLDFGKKQSFQHDIEELTSAKFPNLTKITLNMGLEKNNLKQLLFYPIIGQNSPNLEHLEIGSGLGSQEEMTNMLEPTGLIQKLKILQLFYADTDLLNGLTQFAQNGLLKLTQLSFVIKYNEPKDLVDIFIRLIANQSEFLKILIISITSSHSSYHQSRIRVQFPQLQNLTSLQIDNLSSFEDFFEPINFSLLFPKLEDFRTFQNTIWVFLKKNQNYAMGGDSVKSVTLYKKLPNPRPGPGSRTLYDFAVNLDVVKLGQIFPNLEFLELNALAISDYKSPALQFEHFPFWSKLRKVVINCKFFEILLNRNLPLFKVIKNLKFVVDCKDVNMMDPDLYMAYFGSLIMEKNDISLDYYSKKKFYKKFLTIISDNFKPRHHTTSFTIIGYKISEDFKRDFLSIFPETDFISSTITFLNN